MTVVDRGTARAMLAGLLAAFVCCARGAGADVESPTSRAARLAEEFADPLTTLPQLFLQDVYTPSSYGTEAAANRVVARMIVPRIPKFSLLPFVQLVRPSISLVTVPTGRGEGTVTAFGDMQLLDLAVLPLPGREIGLYVGVGPVFVFPTATDERAGQGAWQVGPALGTIYKGIPGVLLGLLVQNPIAFAYTDRDRPAISTLIVQPVVLVHLWRGLYAKSADSSWTIGWHEGAPRLFPLSFGLGWVILREGVPPLNVFVSGEWLAGRENAPVAPQTTVRFGLTVAFPDWRPWS